MQDLLKKTKTGWPGVEISESREWRTELQEDIVFGQKEADIFLSNKI